MGPVARSRALVGSELHADGSREDKTFAPGYGEFFTGGGGDIEAMARESRVTLLELTRSERWNAARREQAEAQKTWSRATGVAPPRLAPR